MPRGTKKYKSADRRLSSLTRRSFTILGGGMVHIFYAGLICLIGMSAVTTNAADEIARAEAWFNEIKTIKADFVQIATDGTSAEGKLLFRRPSRMKITYRNDGDGNGMQLITSKVWLHVDRPDEKLLTSYPLSETPLSLILAERVSLRPQGYDSRIIQSSAGVLQILIAKEEGEGAASSRGDSPN